MMPPRPCHCRAHYRFACLSPSSSTPGRPPGRRPMRAGRHLPLIGPEVRERGAVCTWMEPWAAFTIAIPSENG
eukprot:9385503-Pyramimonas_sp.AAC.1